MGPKARLFFSYFIDFSTPCPKRMLDKRRLSCFIVAVKVNLKRDLLFAIYYVTVCYTDKPLSSFIHCKKDRNSYFFRLVAGLPTVGKVSFLFITLSYTASQEHESTLLHTDVLDEFLTADHSCTTKYFLKNSYQSW